MPWRIKILILQWIVRAGRSCLLGHRVPVELTSHIHQIGGEFKNPQGEAYIPLLLFLLLDNFTTVARDVCSCNRSLHSQKQQDGYYPTGGRSATVEITLAVENQLRPFAKQPFASNSCSSGARNFAPFSRKVRSICSYLDRNCAQFPNGNGEYVLIVHGMRLS